MTTSYPYSDRVRAFEATWQRVETGQATGEDAELLWAELQKAWEVHRAVRSLVWPLARSYDGATHQPCDDPTCVHDAAQPGHAKCLAARVLAVVNEKTDDKKGS